MIGYQATYQSGYYPSYWAFHPSFWDLTIEWEKSQYFKGWHYLQTVAAQNS